MLKPMLSQYVFREKMTYTGNELRPHWLLERSGVYGSVIGVFRGPCRVETNALVDWEDRLAGDSIGAAEMLHFVAELFGLSLEAGVFAQRLFMVWAERILVEKGHHVVRKGDDLYWNHLKLSVSIATVSPVSVLIHWGINIDATGAPPTVRAGGLNSLIGNSDEAIFGFAKELCAQYIGELEEISIAQCKVRPV